MRVFLLRHGESLGNVDETAYSRLQDHNVPLTQWGYEQAVEAGEFLRKYLEDSTKLRVWYSPFKRTCQTKDGIISLLADRFVESAREDYLLVEQNFGLFSHINDREEQRKLYPKESEMYTQCRKMQGKFYAVPPMGESRAQVAQRVRVFQETLMRDVREGIDNHLLVAHGVTNRAFEMDFLHKGVEWFENEPNPGNCDITLIEGDKERGYSAKKIYEGKIRPASLPRDFKTNAYEADISICG